MSSDQPPKQPTRQERQAAALRENLRKRKEQARERRQPEPAPLPDPAPPKDDSSAKLEVPPPVG